MFVTHPNLSTAINRCVIQCEIEGGVDLRDVAPGTILEVQTMNRVYTVVPQPSGHAMISGHPVFCPNPVLVSICGSTWGGSLLKEQYIGRGMHLEFRHPEYLPITTSRIVEIRELPAGFDRVSQSVAA